MTEISIGAGIQLFESYAEVGNDQHSSRRDEMERHLHDHAPDPINAPHDHREDDEVLGDVRYYLSTRPIVSPDLSVVATPDEDFATSLVRLPAGDSMRLGRCESVRAFDQGARVAAVDGQLVCYEVIHEPGVASRILDVESGDTLLDLEETVVYVAAFGPPGDDGRPSWVIVEDAIPVR